eukprot:evm.model.scf_840.5 EVM.evm.TU.scf_840.5   scf_840:39307-43145(-)
MSLSALRSQISRVCRSSGIAARISEARWGVRSLATESTPAAEKASTEEVKSSSSWVYGIGGLAGAGALFYAAKEAGYLEGLLGVPPAAPAQVDYNAVRQAIADVLDKEDYDDGSYGPVLVRLAWHASGTYDKISGTGGSSGATMRFKPESEHGANAGLAVARDLLEPIKQKFPSISYSDLWTLAGVVAIEEMGGPKIPWRPGRSDASDGSACTPDGRLPDGDKGAAHVREIFERMGFNDQEMVALIGAHTLGRCHADRSGWVNPWTRAPTTFSNLYFQDLKSTKWRKKKNFTPLQYEDPSGELMMLPADMALLWDKGFRKYVDLYAKDEEKFFEVRSPLCFAFTYQHHGNWLLKVRITPPEHMQLAGGWAMGV